ncbi:MAG: DNA-directed polymerase specialized sigma subunit, sigma24 [Thermoleophilia bacterium]|nr:DNA-directed polymerase specialized sigma subunit, sigma24 [Thermoleophilia bacterium]
MIWDRHHLAVFRYVRARLGPAADDVVGDAFAEAFRIRDRFDSALGDSALPWLLGIATRRMSRSRDAERRWIRRAPIDTERGGVDPIGEADERVSIEGLAPWLHAALADLRRRDRITLLLHVTGDLSIEEIAVALDVPPGTVKSRLHRARTILAARLEALR